MPILTGPGLRQINRRVRERQASPQPRRKPTIEIVDLDHFRDCGASHAAHEKPGEVHMSSILTPHREKCPRCGSGLVSLEWDERVNAREVQDLWRCWNCKNEF